MKGDIGKKGIALAKKSVLGELRRLSNQYGRCYFDARTIARRIKPDKAYGTVEEGDVHNFLEELHKEGKLIRVIHSFDNGNDITIYRPRG